MIGRGRWRNLQGKPRFKWCMNDIKIFYEMLCLLFIVVAEYIDFYKTNLKMNRNKKSLT